MNPPSSSDVRAILETDRAWCAYALADLDPVFAPACTWYVGRASVVLSYAGLEPPVLFAHGQSEEVASLFDRVPSGDYQFGLLAVDRAGLKTRLHSSVEKRMWRMALKAEAFEPLPGEAAERLDPMHAGEMQALFADHPDRPDAFHARQLEGGSFFGVRLEGELVSVAGTHVVSPNSSVAALGNVFTRPDLRGRGLARRATSAVVAALLQRGLRTIVLNVAMDNEPALRCYRHLGFWPYVGYYEGVGQLT